MENSVLKPTAEDVITDQPAADMAFNRAQQFSPLAKMFLIYIPSGKTGVIGLNAYAKSLHYADSDDFYFDRNNGKLLGKLKTFQKSKGRKLNDLNYDIPMGQVWGLTGKIIAFLVS